MSRTRYAVIPTRDRPEAYAACVAAVAPQVHEIITVCHGRDALDYAAGVPVLYDRPVPNISAMWNLGIDLLAEAFPDELYDVVILNDDAVVPEQWYAVVAGRMHIAGAAAGCVDQHGRLTDSVLHTVPGPVDLRERLTGFAFILDGTKGIRANEEMRWWGSDDWVDYEARTRGGTLIVPWDPVQHPDGGGTPLLGELAEWWEQDRQRLIDRWGVAPW